MTQILRYAVTAYLETPVNGRSAIVAPNDDSQCVLARTPLAAARIWYWRLAATERAICRFVIVGAWTHPGVTSFPSYDGDEFAFTPAGGWSRVNQPALDQPHREGSGARHTAADVSGDQPFQSEPKLSAGEQAYDEDHAPQRQNGWRPRAHEGQPAD